MTAPWGTGQPSGARGTGARVPAAPPLARPPPPPSSGGSEGMPSPDKPLSRLLPLWQ